MIAPGLRYAGRASDLTSALAWALPSVDAVRVSAAAHPGTRAALAFSVRDVCPVVRGRTVWESSSAPLAVVESPNRYGCIESPPPVSAVLVTTAGAPVADWKPRASLVREGARWHRFGREADPGGEPPDFSDRSRRFAERTAAADHMARRLSQARGTRIAFGRPDSPTFVMLVPAHAERWAAAISAAGDLTAEALEIPGLPGSVRIEVLGALTSEDIAAVVSATQEAAEPDTREASR